MIKEEKKNKLKKIITSFPTTPGVYLMKSSKNKIIYVGKAKNIKKRVSSYLKKDLKKKEPKNYALIQAVKSIDYIPTPTETEALLVEAKLIKENQPKYNVDLKDGKSFPVLAIDKNVDFPRVIITREKDKKKYELFGPFTNVKILKKVYNLMQKIFMFRICNINLVEGDKKRTYYRPCLLYNIKLCSAPCATKISKNEYQDRLKQLRLFIKGDFDFFYKETTKKMKALSENLEYEKAIHYRNILLTLDRFKKDTISNQNSDKLNYLLPETPKTALNDLTKILNLNEMPSIICGVDISVLSGTSAAGGFVTFINGVPFKSAYRRYKIKTNKSSDDYSMIQEILIRKYSQKKEEVLIPDILLIDGGKGHLLAAKNTLKILGVIMPNLVALSKHDGDHLFFFKKNKIMEINNRTSGFKLLQQVRDEAHRFSQNYHKYLRRKKLFE